MPDGFSEFDRYSIIYSILCVQITNCSVYVHFVSLVYDDSSEISKTKILIFRIFAIRNYCYAYTVNKSQKNYVH